MTSFRPTTGQKDRVRIVALITIAVLLSARASAAQSTAENFYKGHSISMIIKQHRLHPRHTNRRGVRLEDATYHNAIRKHVEIVIAPFAG
jgi:hypothetical protein